LLLTFAYFAEYRSVWPELRRNAFICVGWHLTRCDPVWQVTLRSPVMVFQLKAIHHLNFLPLSALLSRTYLIRMLMVLR